MRTWRCGTRPIRRGGQSTSNGAWASDGRYVDPQLEAEGRTALSDMVAAVQTRFPGHRFRRVSGIDNHHNHLRFAWELAAPDGSIVVAGIDVGELASDGRLQRVTGFFGALPARAPDLSRRPAPHITGATACAGVRNAEELP